MMVAQIPGVDARGIEPRRPSFDGYFANKTGLHQIAQIVVGGSAGTARIGAVHRFKDFGRRRMARLLDQESQHRKPLRRAAQTTVFEGPPDCVRVYQVFRLYLI